MLFNANLFCFGVLVSSVLSGPLQSTQRIGNPESAEELLEYGKKLWIRSGLFAEDECIAEKNDEWYDKFTGFREKPHIQKHLIVTSEAYWRAIATEHPRHTMTRRRFCVKGEECDVQADVCTLEAFLHGCKNEGFCFANQQALDKELRHLSDNTKNYSHWKAYAALKLESLDRAPSEAYKLFHLPSHYQDSTRFSYSVYDSRPDSFGSNHPQIAISDIKENAPWIAEFKSTTAVMLSYAEYRSIFNFLTAKGLKNDEGKVVFDKRLVCELADHHITLTCNKSGQVIYLQTIAGIKHHKIPEALDCWRLTYSVDVESVFRYLAGYYNNPEKIVTEQLIGMLLERQRLFHAEQETLEEIEQKLANAQPSFWLRVNMPGSIFTYPECELNMQIQDSQVAIMTDEQFQLLFGKFATVPGFSSCCEYALPLDNKTCKMTCNTGNAEFKVFRNDNELEAIINIQTLEYAFGPDNNLHSVLAIAHSLKSTIAYSLRSSQLSIPQLLKYTKQYNPDLAAQLHAEVARVLIDDCIMKQQM